MIRIQRILVPVDFSESTGMLLDWATHLSREHSAALTLLHAYHLPVEFQQIEGAYLPPDFWTRVGSDAERSLARLSEALRSRGVTSETALCEGYAGTVIVEEAARREIDLIVIGTHGLSGLKHLLLGSIAERVVQKAPCPVLTVNTATARAQAKD